MYEKYAKHFNDEITEGIKEFAYDKALEKSRYIFIRREGNKKKYNGYCTHCNKEFDTEYHKHKSYIKCPICGTECQARSAGISRMNLRDKACFIRYDKSVVDKETLIGRAFFVERNYSGDYKNVKTEIVELARYIFEPGESVMFEQTSRWYSDKLGKWCQKSSICRYNRDGFNNMDDYIDWSSLEEATKDNRFQYSMYKKYGVDGYYKSMAGFFEVYNKYPIIEQLTKIGFRNIVERMFKGWSMENSVNWRRKDNVFKFLKLNKAQVKEIVNSGVEITPKLLNIYRQSKKEKWNLNLDDLKEIEKLINSKWRRKNISEYTTWCKAYKYITKQFDKYRYYELKEEVLSTWIDYLCDCDKLEFNAKEDENILFPKDVHQQHLNFTAQIKYIENIKLQEGFDKQRERREKLRFEYKDLICFAAMSQKELIEEGKAMSHCVGGYAESCSEGKTDIIFIRKKSAPDKAYVTMEIRKDEIIQVRAYKNGKPDDDVNKFVEEYKRNVLKRLKSKRKKVA